MEKEGSLTADNRVFRRVDEFRTKLYKDIKNRVAACNELQDQDRIFDEMDEDIGERMDFDNIENKLGKKNFNIDFGR